MKNVILIVGRKNVIHVHKFNTITDAYFFYLDEFATFGDWWYYLRCAHKLLNHVCDERIMESIFRNVFDENTILLLDNGQ